jgi:hypothetical protein
MGRVRGHTANERAGLAAEQRSSGKTQIVWCEDHGISIRTFSRWALGAQGREIEDNRAVDWVKLNGFNSTLSLSSVSDAVIEISVGAYTVRVKPGFDRETMSDISRSAVVGLTSDEFSLTRSRQRRRTSAPVCRCLWGIGEAGRNKKGVWRL